jgi:Peptidase M15
MSRFSVYITAALLLAMTVAGCGSQVGSTGSSATAGAPLPTAHPQAVEPAAGVQAAAAADSGTSIVGDPTAHARSLTEVKREIKELNLCGGVTNVADAQPVTTASGPGFVADPGTSQTEGQLPILTARLNALALALHVTIYGISGYRTPAHSVAVGGYADDPHTKGEAEDIGVNSLLRSSAARISEAQLAQYGLYRPFDPSDNPGNTEVNHIQLIPTGGPLSAATAAADFTQDPICPA